MADKVEVIINNEKVIKKSHSYSFTIVQMYDPPYRRYQKDGQNWLIWP